MRTGTRFVVLFVCLFSVCGFSQQPSPTPAALRAAHPTAPQTPQEVLLLFAGSRADERTLLTLNNNHVADLLVKATVYTASGQETALPDFRLSGSESRIVELSAILQTAGLGRQELGWLKINYTGVYLGLGAQLTLYGVGNSPGVDSPRSLSNDFSSQTRRAVFWMPRGANARITLTNSSSSSLHVELQCGLILESFTVATQKRRPARWALGI